MTIGVILEELADKVREIKGASWPKITRAQLTFLEKEKVFVSERSLGKWRIFSREEADIIERLVLEYYKIIEKKE